MSVLRWTCTNTYSPPDLMTEMGNSMISGKQEEPEETEEYCVTSPHG